MSIDTETGEVVNISTDEFQCSPDIAELSTALCKAQGAMTGAVKDSANPFFKSRYADLSAVWDDIRRPFAENGVSVIQMPVEGVNGVGVITQLSHSSGQWMRSKLALIPTKKVKDQSGQAIEVATNDPQVVGSCITYARRYALASLLRPNAYTDCLDPNQLDGWQCHRCNDRLRRYDLLLYLRAILE